MSLLPVSQYLVGAYNSAQHAQSAHNVGAPLLQQLAEYVHSFTELVAGDNTTLLYNISHDMEVVLPKIGAIINYQASQFNYINGHLEGGLNAMRVSDPELHQMLCPKDLSAAKAKLSLLEGERAEARLALSNIPADADIEAEQDLMARSYKANHNFKQANSSYYDLLEKCIKQSFNASASDLSDGSISSVVVTEKGQGSGVTLPYNDSSVGGDSGTPSDAPTETPTDAPSSSDGHGL